MSDGFEWVSLVEGARMIARALSGNTSDTFALGIWNAACGTLLQALRKGEIKSEGWREDGVVLGEVTALDWQKLRPDISNSRLLERVPSMRRVHLDRIRDIAVDAGGIRKLVSSVSRASSLRSLDGRPHSASAEPSPESDRPVEGAPLSAAHGPHTTGVAGRPSSAWLCAQELARRIDQNEAFLSTEKECEHLAQWLRDRPAEAPLTAKALRNNAEIQRLMNKYKSSRNKTPE